MTTMTAAQPTGTSCGWTGYDRYLGTCKGCKTTFAVTIPGGTFAKEVRRCPTCNKLTAVEQVFGAVSATKDCDARCINAKRSSCECSCGGANHGGGH